MAADITTPAYHPFALFARADNGNVKFNESKYENIECPAPFANLLGTGLPLFGAGTINLHRFMVYVSAPCVLVTLLSCWFLSWRHLHRYTAPQEQRQILRIINLPLAYGLFNFLALTFTMDYFYIQEIGAIYEAFAVAALFYLLQEYIAPDGTDRDAFFAGTELKGKKGKIEPGGSLVWYHTIYASVLQYPLFKTILIVIMIVTQYFGDYCIGSFSIHHAHLYLFLADLLFVGGALGAAVRFSMRFKHDYDPARRARQKVWTFLGIIFFQIIQDLLFGLLNGKVFKPTQTATYNDINFGIAAFMTCIESVFFSLLMQWSYSASEFKEGMRKDRLGLAPAQRIGTFRAIGNALNPADIVAGTAIAMKMLLQKILQRFGGQQATRSNVHLEPLQRGGRDAGYGRESPDDYGTGYAAGYNAPLVPPPMARDPSPGGTQGRVQTYRADELRPDAYSREESYGRRSGEGAENEPLQTSRSMV